MEFEKNYKPDEFEFEILNLWKKFNCFEAKVNKNKKPFSVVLPPPNITGKLHMGHALNITLQDIIVRFKRMSGFETLFLPGVDHASIATEAKIVENLRKQGKTKEQLGRDEFLKLAFEWKEKFESTIYNQIKRLGASADFSRKCFTMDSFCKDAVNEFFVSLFKEGLVYRGERVINWCFKCKTSISDAEVNHQDESSFLWHLKYKLADKSNEFIEVATTRPETIFGDVAVAVNPNDSRYEHIIGKEVLVPLINRKIPIVADEYVDLEFGTGAVKITPAHDFNDFEIGLRHKLKIIRVFDFDGKLNDNAGELKNLKLEDARNVVIEELKNNNLLEKIVPLTHSVGHCYRCGEIVEPIISKQWFVKMKTLAKPAIDAVKNGDLVFIPKHFEKVYLNWLNSIKDWCVSRQLWWGHQVPAWHCENCGEMFVEKNKPEVCVNCGSSNLRPDSDTLDTWFSSALWPFATMGWPDVSKPDFKYFYPTNILVTGYDIIFFWVVRMVFSALKTTGKVPFEKVIIHGIVRDDKGRKMSKSLNNGVDPLEIIDEVGADALRFVLANNLNPGSDVRWSSEKLISARNFVNKIWNASRFVFLNVEKFNFKLNGELPKKFEIYDLWILAKLNELILEITHNLENFEISIACQKLYDFVWDKFCSWFVELSKIRLNGSAEEVFDVLAMLTYLLKIILKLLHPFMPFLTEQINLIMFFEKDMPLAVSEWPVLNLNVDFQKGLEFEKIVDCVKKIRNIRTELKVDKSRKTDLIIETKYVNLFKNCEQIFQNLASANNVKIVDELTEPITSNFVKIATDSARVFIDISNVVDFDKERTRILKEIDICEKEINFCSSNLNNERFIQKAPDQIIQKQIQQLHDAQLKLEKLQQSLDEILDKNI